MIVRAAGARGCRISREGALSHALQRWPQLPLTARLAPCPGPVDRHDQQGIGVLCVTPGSAAQGLTQRLQYRRVAVDEVVEEVLDPGPELDVARGRRHEAAHAA